MKTIITVSVLAIQKGYIESVDQSIFDYLPEHQEFNTGMKSRITIEHILTMTSGLEWNEWSSKSSLFEILEKYIFPASV